ncbi:carbohydrate ABC transporter permease [Anaerolineae bacterium CFX9]|jgi:ABC-type glycerol-3-phosphate transport system permease component|uniref:Carbohydrate ABC transporter permease n=1 Tax=Geitlerinema calcuttense NRMC-F 0142 TaxID=2922238 RepID=A0ABT7LXU2_9CYAN|nr:MULTISPECIES: carbohydrate ABC transporter permease [Cyanophyceae]MDL1900648.1 carbohydrate ABC transporter permease [Anaerolineae bacterium CFX9]MDL5055300.1 carbohydrate ABC transporter permease [Oscillatoria laete-virens NRMC-F 0139]MDL5056205.1 carbohydrate ABC transporter permease [Geitlerinema calcuttense NRMC-F 0142]
MESHFARRMRQEVPLYLLILVILLVMLFPIAWMLSTSMKTPAEVFAIPATWIPNQISWDNYLTAFNATLLRFFANSLIVALGTMVLSTLAGSMAAYALSRFPFRGSNALLLFFLATMAFPLPLLMISMYTLFSQLRLLNSYWALILGHTVITLPIVVWLLKSFFDSLPREIEEAAYIDGASPFHTFVRIVLPISRPGLAAAAIFGFVTSWNEFIMGLSFTSSTDMRPLPAGISLVFLQEFQYRWAEMMAVATLATLPILIIFLLFQRNFIQGLTAGAVKG